jgi:hypothetical protein
MSFSLLLNSKDGTRVISNSINQVTYNLDFNNTPKHSGAYYVYMTFVSSRFEMGAAVNSFKDMYVNANLGRFDAFTPVGLFTGTKNNQVLGVVKMINTDWQDRMVVATPSVPFVGTAVIPNNAGTVGYTETENTVAPANGYQFHGRRFECGALYYENSPVHLSTKPTNNQFTVRLTNADGTLHTDFSAAPSTAPGGAYYSMILTFEAI